MPSVFLIKEATTFAQDGSVDAFEAIFVLLIYGLALFPNIDGFVDVNAIRLFLIGNPVPILLGDMYFSLHLRNCKGGINYNPVLARRQLGFPLRDNPNNTLLEGLFYQEGKDPQHLKQKIVHAWHNVHRKGRFELGPCNCVALEAYTLWVKKRDMKLKMPYPCERPMSMVVVVPLTLPNKDVEELEDALAKMKQEKDMGEECFHALSKKHEELQLESKDKYALIELLEDRVTKRQRARAKLTHRYNTRANHQKIMEHLEQENRELKGEIARLTAMMESVLAAQSQASPMPATPPARTVISEVVTSTVPAATAHFAPSFPIGFPCGMPPNFVSEGFAPTFASMPASSLVMYVPPPVVHTLPRVEDTIYHSEPSEGPDVYEKMD
ncbi:hypothetical protein KIW84_031403 [Lathyrus oleraceus]|uniref:DUF7745 domain-containing protein n=1 Tax=Pisum sativum TaxID=3888 RepID=A0A9D4XQG0_PEA|nr:hypothetical protein KIW84_031403 [Pisum sativum]